MKLFNYYKLFGIFIAFCVVVLLSIFYFYKEYRVEKILDKHTNINIQNYDSSYHYYKLVSNAINKSLVNTNSTMNILMKIKDANPTELNEIREELKKHLSENYIDLREINFKQFHFHLKDNTSFLRMHKPNRFGDNLTNYRYGVSLVNKTLNAVDGFEEGKVISAFRFIYPILDNLNDHIGSVEISVGSSGIIQAMHNYLKQDIHFIIKKSVVNKIAYKDELIKYYKDSVESPLYYVESEKELNKMSCIHSDTKNQILFMKKIAIYLRLHKSLSIYKEGKIISFIPIKNIKNEDVAYFVIYEKSDDIKNIIYIYWLLNIVILFISLVIYYILYKDYSYRILIIRTNKSLSLKVKHEIKKNEYQAIRNYITLFNTIPQSSILINPRTMMIVDVNKAAVQKYGFSKKELLTMSIEDFYFSKEKDLKLFSKEVQSKKTSSFETIQYKKDGTKTDVIINISKILIAKKVHHLLIATDITDIKMAQKEIKFHRDTLQTIVYILNELITENNFNQAVENSFKKIVSILDIDRVYIFKNHNIEDKLVCSQKYEFVKENISSELDNPDLQNILYDEAGLKRWKELFLNNQCIEGLVKNFPDKEKAILEVQDIKSILVIPIWDKNELWGFVGFDDCTQERKWHKLEKDILRAFSHTFISAYKKEKFSDELQNQVSIQIGSLREKDEQLLQQSKLAQMGDMISMIAHQWRQPLNAISATGINLSLLSSMEILTDEKLQEDSVFLQDQCQKMSSTIDTFINFVKPTKESKTFSLIHTVTSVLQIMQAQLENHNIEISINHIDKDDEINGYEDLLEQVIINIFSNARDAFKDSDIKDKKIIITVLKVDDIPTIRIEDNAGGIPSHVKNKIFNPYFTTKEQGSGIGIGLYMSMDIMKKRFNGNLKYIDIENGSAFELVCGGGGEIDE